MASRVLAAIDSSAFGTFTGIFRNYGPQVIHGLIIISTISGQSLIGKLTFDCPCAYPLNVYLSTAFIFGPSIVLFVFALIINPQTWKIMHGYCYRTPQIRHSALRVCRRWLLIFEQSCIAPVAWIFVAFLNGNYYTCMKAAKFCHKYDTNLCNATFSLEEAATLDLTNDNSDICPLCLCSLDPKSSRYLRSESQVIAWIFITIVSTIALISICLIRIFDKHTYIHWQYIQMYQKEEKRIFDETSKEYARKIAEIHADIFFNKGIRTKRDWDALSVLQNYQHIPKNRLMNKQHLYEDEIFTALQKWAYKYENIVSPVSAELSEQQRLTKKE
uniref:Calcium homeostasis modulator 1 n=1 Tax=Panagrolaimus sp. PS1159 TaxID=55785 RepID=A0AC35FXG4_9BILA